MFSMTFLLQALAFFVFWQLLRKVIPPGLFYRLRLYRRFNQVRYATVITDMHTGRSHVYRQRRKSGPVRKRYSTKYRSGGAVRRDSWRYVNAS